MEPSSPLELLFWLTAAHFAADFPLQSDFIARNKHPSATSVWGWVLSAHAAVHAAFVGLILSPILGLAEFAAHALTDHAKGQGWLGREPGAFHIDQLLHLAAKVVWLSAFLWGPPLFRG